MRETRLLLAASLTDGDILRIVLQCVQYMRRIGSMHATHYTAVSGNPPREQGSVMRRIISVPSLTLRVSRHARDTGRSPGCRATLAETQCCIREEHFWNSNNSDTSSMLPTCTVSLVPL